MRHSSRFFCPAIHRDFLSGNLNGPGLLVLGFFDKRSCIILGEPREGVGTSKKLDIEGNLIRV